MRENICEKRVAYRRRLRAAGLVDPAVWQGRMQLSVGTLTTVYWEHTPVSITIETPGGYALYGDFEAKLADGSCLYWQLTEEDRQAIRSTEDWLPDEPIEVVYATKGRWSTLLSDALQHRRLRHRMLRDPLLVWALQTDSLDDYQRLEILTDVWQRIREKLPISLQDGPEPCLSSLQLKLVTPPYGVIYEAGHEVVLTAHTIPWYRT